MPARLPHRRHARRTPSPPAAIPQHAVDRHHDRPAREARPRGAAGRHRPRAVARPQLRHPVRAARRASWSAAIALLADIFLRFTFWGGGRRSRSRERRRGRGRRRSSFVIAIVLAILAPIIGRVRPARRQPPARVPRRRLERRADPQPVRPRARAGEDRRRPGGARGRQPGDPAPVHRQPDQEVRGSAPRACSSTHPPIVDRINRLRALTGEPPLDAARSGSLAGLD